MDTISIYLYMEVLPPRLGNAGQSTEICSYVNQ